MSLLKLFCLVLGLGASQAIAREVQASHAADRLTGWWRGVLVQYAICLALLLVIDNASLHEAIGPAVALTWFVRIYFCINDAK